MPRLYLHTQSWPMWLDPKDGTRNPLHLGESINYIRSLACISSFIPNNNVGSWYLNAALCTSPSTRTRGQDRTMGGELHTLECWPMQRVGDSWCSITLVAPSGYFLHQSSSGSLMSGHIILEVSYTQVCHARADPGIFSMWTYTASNFRLLFLSIVLLIYSQFLPYFLLLL